ncbi:MAG: hypothetical protein FWF82_01280 [Oscillospiraceae bacterium]|nr:hypothetical protein [Oscillospiraceae bacterium]
MATETFYKRIILSDEAAEKLAEGLERPRLPFKRSERKIEEDRKRSDEWIKRFLSHSDN